jgi:hypothetical protein
MFSGSGWKTDYMKRQELPLVSPRWLWARGGSRLFGPGGVEYHHVSTLERAEVERLLTLDELDAVQVECGAGITEWVGPTEARRLWLGVEGDLRDVEGWRPPSEARGMQQYEAELWRSADGHHVMVFVNE